MPSHGSSPARLMGRLSVSSMDSLEPRDHPSLVARQVSLAPQTQLLTASVAPSPSTFLPQSAQTISLRAIRVDNSFLNTSLASVTKSSPIGDEALIAGTISALVIVGGLVGAVCYGKKRPGRMENDKPNQVNVRKKAPRKRGGLLIPEDVEANHGNTFRDFDDKSYLLSVLSFFGDDKIKRVNSPKYSTTSSLDPSTPQDSTSLCTSILERSVDSRGCDWRSLYLPWNTYGNLSPVLASPSSTINADTMRCAQPNPDPETELKMNDSDGVDIGAVALSSLCIHDCEVVDLPGPNNLLGRSDSFLDARNWGAKMIPYQLDRHMGEEAPAETTAAPHSIVCPSLVRSLSEGLNIMVERFYHAGLHSSNSLNVQEKPDDSPHTTLSPRVSDTPKLLEVLRFESEVDLRTCLGLDAEEDIIKGIEIESEISTVPGLVVTNSEDTVTGSDESFNGIQIVDVPPRIQRGKFGSRDASIQHSAMSVKETQPYGASKVFLPVFEHDRAPIVCLKTVPVKAKFTASPDALNPPVHNQPLLHSGCSSSSASSNSVVTLKLPSFHSPEHALLTKEILPPTIIVSVPTDGSIRLGSGREAMCIGSTEAEPKTQTQKHAPLLGGVVARVVYDPVDESEDDAWDEAYAESCFAEAISSTETRARGIDGSWVVSSESSDLDLVGKFPLPPK